MKIKSIITIFGVIIVISLISYFVFESYQNKKAFQQILSAAQSCSIETIGEYDGKTGARLKDGRWFETKKNSYEIQSALSKAGCKFKYYTQ